MSVPDVQTLRSPRVNAWLWLSMGIIYIAMGAVFGWLGLTAGRHSSGLPWGLGAGVAFVLLGVRWSVRALSARVELTRDTMVVHGYVVSHRIPRKAIIGFGSNGSVEWTKPSGTQVTTMIFVLGQMRPVTGSPSPLQRHFANDDFSRMADWVSADHALTQNW